MNPRHSLRKLFGLYEHELNGWLRWAIPCVHRVLDVGANDGYFTFGAAAAMRRAGNCGEIIAFEPSPAHVADLTTGLRFQSATQITINVVHRFVSDKITDNSVTLDSVMVSDHERTLIKIDVEGAELDVLYGATKWLCPNNLFCIEVHRRELLDEIRARLADYSISVLQIDQQPHWLLGRETRDVDNWWLVTDPSTFQA